MRIHVHKPLQLRPPLRRQRAAGREADAGVGDDDVERADGVGAGQRGEGGGDGGGRRAVHLEEDEARGGRAGRAMAVCLLSGGSRDEAVQGLSGRVRGVADGGDDGVVWAGEVGGDEAAADAWVVVCVF